MVLAALVAYFVDHPPLWVSLLSLFMVRLDCEFCERMPWRCSASFITSCCLLFSRPDVSSSLRLHGLQHTRPSVPHRLPEFAWVHVHCISDAIQPSRPLSSPCPPAFNLSSIRVFSNELAVCIRWPKCWNFRCNISPTNEYSGLISFKIDWFDLIAVQGALKSFLKHHSSKASILQRSAFFLVQLSQPYMTTGKTIAWLYGPLSAKWHLCFLIH